MSDTAELCGAPHYDHPETLCTEPAGHYKPIYEPHAGPLVIDGREIGGAAWDEPKEPTVTDTPTPAPGQIWQDNDPRGYGRKVRIVEIGDTHAIVELHQPRLPVSSAKPGRRTRIRLDRFKPTSTGYRYISGGEQS